MHPGLGRVHTTTGGGAAPSPLPSGTGREAGQGMEGAEGPGKEQGHTGVYWGILGMYVCPAHSRGGPEVVVRALSWLCAARLCVPISSASLRPLFSCYCLLRWAQGRGGGGLGRNRREPSSSRQAQLGSCQRLRGQHAMSSASATCRVLPWPTAACASRRATHTGRRRRWCRSTTPRCSSPTQA